MKSLKSKQLPPIHPGEVLLEDFLKPMGVTRYRFAKQSGISFRALGDIVRKKSGVGITTGFRLAKATKTSPLLWFNLQHQYNEEMKRLYPLTKPPKP